jgi:hypothetical protein
MKPIRTLAASLLGLALIASAPAVTVDFDSVSIPTPDGNPFTFTVPGYAGTITVTYTGSAPGVADTPRITTSYDGGDGNIGQHKSLEITGHLPNPSAYVDVTFDFSIPIVSLGTTILDLDADDGGLGVIEQVTLSTDSGAQFFAFVQGAAVVQTGFNTWQGTSNVPDSAVISPNSQGLNSSDGNLSAATLLINSPAPFTQFAIRLQNVGTSGTAQIAVDRLDFQPIPEPSTALLIGLAGLLGILRRRRR